MTPYSYFDRSTSSSRRPRRGGGRSFRGLSFALELLRGSKSCFSLGRSRGGERLVGGERRGGERDRDRGRLAGDGDLFLRAAGERDLERDLDAHSD